MEEILKGYYRGWMPSRELYPVPKLEYCNPWQQGLYFYGYLSGLHTRLEKIFNEEWTKIGGVYGPIPEGTTREDWKGQKEIVKSPQRPPGGSTRGRD